MTGLYSNSGGGGGLYGKGKSSSGGGHHGGGGFLGGLEHAVEAPAHFVSHLASDVKDTALGLPGGIAESVAHPIRTAEAMGKSTWQDWSPLFHGHVGQWAHNFYSHPLAPLLDVAAVVGIAAAPFTAGASLSLDAGDAAFQDANVLGKVGQAAKAGKLKYDLGNGVKVDRTLRRSPVARVRQVAMHQLVQKAQPFLPNWTSEAARGTRMLERQVQRRAGALNTQIERQVAEHAQVSTLVDAGHKLSLPKWRTSVLHYNYQQLITHAFKLKPGEKIPQGFVYVEDVSRPHEPGAVLSHYQKHTPKLETYADVREAKQFTSERLPIHLGGQGPLPGVNRARGGLSVARDVQERLQRALDRRNLAQTAKLTSKADALAARANVSTFDAFRHELETLDKKVLTRDVNRAMTDEHGNLLVVPRHTAKMMGKEGARSASFVYNLATAPWKLLQVGYAPRMVVNNSVGNVAMTMLEHDPLTFFKGVFDSMRQLGKNKEASTLVDHLNSKYLPRTLEHHVSDLLDSPSAAEQFAGKAKSGVKGRLRSGLYPLVHKQEQFLKRVSINASLRSSGEVKALMRDGKPFEQAAGEAMTANPVLRDQVVKRAFDTMGDYRTFTAPERAAREVMPFFSWDKHIVLHSASMLDEHPVKLALLGAEGKQGKQAIEHIIGQVPSYVEGVLPVSMLGIGKGGVDIPGVGKVGASGNGTTGVLSARGLNPYSTVGDLAGFVRSLTVGGGPNPGEEISGAINPLVTSAIEHITGQRLGTHVPVKNSGGLIPSVIADTAQNLSYTRLANLAVHGTPTPKPNKRTGKTTPFLYSKDAKTQVAALLGVPVKQMNVSRAHALAEQERTGKKPRSRRHSGGAGLYG